MILPRRALRPPPLVTSLGMALLTGAMATALWALLWLDGPAPGASTGLSLALMEERSAVVERVRSALGSDLPAADIDAVAGDEVARLTGLLARREAVEPLPALVDVRFRGALEPAERATVETRLGENLPEAEWLWWPATPTSPNQSWTIGILLGGVGLGVWALLGGRQWIRRNRPPLDLARLHGATEDELRRTLRARLLWPTVRLTFATMAVTLGLIALGLAVSGLSPQAWLPAQGPIAMVWLGASLAGTLVSVWLLQYLGAVLALHWDGRRFDGAGRGGR